MEELVSERQLLEAERGLIRLLHAKRFPRDWIERHAPEAMARARTDLAARIAAGKENDDVVNLLVVIAYRRALKVLRSEKSAPTTSIETVFHLADEATPTPEQEAIERDRQERVVKALSHLPERERALLALVYFEGMSIRAAGRRLGWGKSAVDRHHRAALDRLHAMLDRSLLAPEIAVPAFIASRHGSAPRAVGIWVQGAAETIRDAVLLGGGRAAPLADTGASVALSGAGRAAAGVCGAAVAVCLAGAASGVVGPGVAALGVEDSRPSEALPSQAAPPAPQLLEEKAAPSATGGQPPRGGGDRQRVAPRRTGDEPRRARRASGEPATAAGAPAAAGRQTASEFAVEGGAPEEPAGSASGEPAPVENAPIAPRPETSSRPSTEASGATSSSGQDASPEFGL